LRKPLLAVLALPVVLVVYLGAFLRPSIAIRAGLAILLVGLVGFGVGLATRPAPVVATAPTSISPVPDVAFTTTVQAGTEVHAPAIIEFSTPMEATSVAAALRVEPATDVRLAWSADARTLTITPSVHWAPATFHTVTVEPGALASTGRPLTSPVRASFLTRARTAATLAPTKLVGERVALDTAFTVVFDAAVDPASARSGVRLSPAVESTVEVEPAVDGATRVVVTPRAPLAPGTVYRLVVAGACDSDGLEIPEATLEVRTPTAPKVVRFRPAADAEDVARDQLVSVRFSRPMDRATTRDALVVTADGKAVDGTLSFTEDDTVVVFEPAERFAYDAAVVATVAATATSRDGVPLGRATEASFDVVPKPAPKPEAPAGGGGGGSGGGGSGDSGGSGGGSAGSGSWSAVERYYLDLMNCTRTGGSVTSSGRCSSPGGRDVAPLKLSSGISSKVARPYAKLLATRNLCSHFIGGDPGDRLRKAGYSSYRWAENLGCRSGDPYDAVLASHRYFQSERDWSPQGGHYVNLMNAKYDRAGIGVWVASGRVRLVVVFYHP
jgi:uncharacterized protein YkwD/uncharacterized membrane protein YgcG